MYRDRIGQGHAVRILLARSQPCERSCGGADDRALSFEDVPSLAVRGIERRRALRWMAAREVELRKILMRQVDDTGPGALFRLREFWKDEEVSGAGTRDIPEALPFTREAFVV